MCEVAETARKLGICVISDEVYEHLSFGNNPFVPMGVFGSIAPVLTLGSISKRWIVPGWRLGWMVTNDPHDIFENSGFWRALRAISTSLLILLHSSREQFLKYFEKTKEGFFAKIINIIRESADICYERIKEIPCITCPHKPEGSMYVMGALPHILEKTERQFFMKITNTLRQASEICYDRIKEIPCMTCSHKPEGCMFMMVKLNLSMLEGIVDDMDFCLKLAKEEYVILTPELASLVIRS